MKRSLKSSLLLIMGVPVIVSLAATASAQTPAVPTSPRTVYVAQEPAPVAKPKTDKPEKRRPTTAIRQARVKMVQDQEPVSPQIVTVIHRLNGLTLLRKVLRESGEPGTVATINPDAVTKDVHASIIAGLALEDGRTILARLPQVSAEMEVYRSNVVVPKSDKSDDDSLTASAHRTAPRAPRIQPDLTIMTQDGKTFRARYVGIDGQTGLSVLQVTQALTDITDSSPRKVSDGESVRVFAPQQVSSEVPYEIRVRIGKTDAKIARLAKAKIEADRVTLRGAKLSPMVLGGVACNQAGQTVGIVDEIEGTNAKLVTAEAVRAAARRVLERQSSVPRPLLGIRGEEIDSAAKNWLLSFGWNEQQLQSLFDKQIGIVLTSVLPGTPAAFAKLHPGDIIVRVDGKDVKGADEFSQMLRQAGMGEDVKFTVERPNMKTPMTFEVKLKLGGAFQPDFEWKFEAPAMPKIRMNGGLKDLGVEAVPLSTKSATQWGIQGMLVVSVEPDSAAGRAGLKEGDVIEAIDGRTVGRGAWTYVFAFNKKEKHTFSVVRAKEKKQIVVEPVDD